MNHAAVSHELDLDAIVALLDRQCAVCEKLKLLSARQSELVASGEAEMLLGVLGARKTLIEELTSLDAQLGPVRKQWRSMLDGMAAADRDRVGQRIQKVEQALAAILEQDDRDRERLSGDRKRTQGELSRLSRGTAAANAYRAAATAYRPAQTTSEPGRIGGNPSGSKA